jgi:class 3 adenylate cyclase/tetratricopeptide (TPR) repeat protein
MMQCPTCGAPLAESGRFCPACGTPVSSAQHGGETRKVVTVVFCDLVGSTALSGRLDPETLRTVTLRYFDLMRQRIEAHGGTVEKFIGDAVMAVFGVPVMHEDDARRAATAALDMLRSLDAYNAELDRTLGVRLDVRIGVNTGEVVATADASMRQALVSGEVVNVAARLEQNAPAGTVLVGAATREAAGGTLDLRPTGPLSLKGKDGPVTAYRLLGVGPDDPRLVRRFDVPFVGRDRELAWLRRIGAEVAGGAGARLMLVCGEAGLGKTRLVSEWQSADGRPAVHFGSGRCRPHRDQGTLAPLADALQQILEDPVARASMLRDESAAPALQALLSGLFQDGMPTASVADTCVAVAAVVGGLAAHRPVVVCVDDCHWADPVLLDVLDWLCGALTASAVLVVCLARPEMLEWWPRWAEDRPGLERLVLRPLAAEQTAVLAAHLVEVGMHAATGPVLERAEGNPFLLEQLLAVLREDTPRDRLPLTVHALLAARVDALPAAERAVLDHAAVIGRDFDEETLAHLAEPDPDGPPGGGVRVAVRALARRRLVEPVRRPGAAGTGYRFSSLLIHEVTYQGMPKRVRAQVHQRLSGILHARGAGPAVTGGHLERAYGYRVDLGLRDEETERVRQDAARSLAEAGRTALARADLSWSANLLERANGLSRPGEPVWTRAAQALAEAYLATGRGTEGGELLRRVLAAARQAGDAPAAAHARLYLAVLDPGPAMAEPARVARESVRVFRHAGDDLGLARAYLRIAQEQQFLGRHAAAEELLEVSLRHCERAAAEPERAMALGALGISLWLGPVPAGTGAGRGTALLAGDGGSRGVVRLALNCPLAVLFALQRRTAEAAGCLAVAEELAGDLGYVEAAAFVPIFAAQVQSLAGRLDDAERLLRQAIAACRRMNDTALLPGASRDLARVLLRMEKVAEVAAFAPLPRNDRAPSDAADGYGIRARLAAVHGRSGPALRLAERAVAQARRTDSPVVRAVADLDLAETCRLLDLPDRAVPAADRAREAFQGKGHLVGVDWTAGFGPARGRDEGW